MKKYFYLAAVSAMMLTACSSDKDVLQPTPEPTQQVIAQQQAVAFDTYLSGTTASTRAGETGVMTTSTLQTTGFGAFATLSDDGDYASTIGPNFMFNQEVTYASPGWAYTPLKYWPNETTADMYNATGHATATELDKLSFFAYAPYVTGSLSAPGISGMSTNTATTDPTVTWTYSTNPDENVDLLWGVAPAGFSYTNVNGTTTSVPVGMPLLNLVKPDKDQKIKFLFQHALSRISLSVVSAIDQIAAGDDAGTFTSDPTTKVLIKSVTVTGNLGQTGTLNLNNTESNVAKWTRTPVATTFTINGKTTDGKSGSADGNYFLAPDLRYVETQISAVNSPSTFAAVNTGVLPSEQVLLSGDKDDSKSVTNPTFAYGKVYYKSAGTGDKGYVVASVSHVNNKNLFIKDEKGDYTQVYTTTNTPIALDGNSPTYYEVDPGTAATAALTATKEYYKEGGSAGHVTYTKITATGSETDWSTVNYYLATGFDADPTAVSETYTSGTYYTALMPRYFMVIPTGATDINVNIVYAVVTYDAKLNGYVSNVENNISKTVNVDLKNGKSYNLKLTLGLTSVKLDATVADWKVDGSTEVDLPQNAE